MFAASILRAFAAEVALKAIAIKATGTCSRVHDLLQLFDELDQNARACIEQQGPEFDHKIPRPDELYGETA